jgi:polyvinyl alcohol dehydrogenase (cytochrome)
MNHIFLDTLTAGDAYKSNCPLAGKANCPDTDGPHFEFGSSPILLSLKGNRRMLVLPQKSGTLHGVDPDQQGKILWDAEVGQGDMLGGIQSGAATDGDRIYVALSDIRFSAKTATGRNPDPNHGGGMFAFRAGKGGALDAGGPMIAGGRLFVGSGYGQWSGMPGKVLLAFAAE